MKLDPGWTGVVVSEVDGTAVGAEEGSCCSVWEGLVTVASGALLATAGLEGLEGIMTMSWVVEF